MTKENKLLDALSQYKYWNPDFARKVDRQILEAIKADVSSLHYLIIESLLNERHEKAVQYTERVDEVEGRASRLNKELKREKMLKEKYWKKLNNQDDKAGE